MELFLTPNPLLIQLKLKHKESLKNEKKSKSLGNLGLEQHRETPCWLLFSS